MDSVAASDALGILSSMARRTTNESLTEVLPGLLKERGLSLRALARQVGVTDAHLSRALRRANYKAVSGQLAARIAIALGMPEDFFPETRERFVVDAVKNEPALRDRIYRQLKQRSA